MWSGPRNISTAMMRAWENRADTVVVDEPLYGPYLATTGKQHAMYEAIIADQGADWRPIAHDLAHSTPPDADDKTQIYYQKHMSHHLTDDIELDFVKHLKNAFLLRHPNDVLSSYIRKESDATPADLGYPQQVKLFDWIRTNTGIKAPVFAAKDILLNPADMLRTICTALTVPFDADMLSWPKGYRDSDGIWAEHWYNRVITSTGFAQYQSKANHLTPAQQRIADACLPYYEYLQQHKITAIDS